MWRDRREPFAEYPATDAIWLTLGAVILAAGLLVWTVGQVAALLFGAHHFLPMPAEEMAGVLWNLPGNLNDPAHAWPPSVRRMLPGPVGMYAALVLVVWGPVLLVGLLVRRLHPRRRRERKAKGARWASLWQLRRLLVAGPRSGRIVLGRRDRWRDLLMAKVLLAVEQCHSVLCFGPPGSYKTHALVIPAILEWQGGLVATSIKPD
ncbi:MAG TPA: type IV secretory system conjugative DNA transfer family protein, partial [Actinomycetota bacterium]|nr:type IV secretory system conjugative DNA transfer family protein [Actinomycetota bacterium]